MSNMEILEEFSGCNDQTIVKGKRSKRLRPSSSASSSGGEFICNSSPATSTSTEEDEDMANCLILLARGGSQTTEEDEAKPTTESIKFIGRKFTEMSAATSGGARIGVYVYECKVCSRTFPSFQALGGHRASHKKPKPTMVDADRKKSPPPISANRIVLNIENKSKIHECSICGSEFASGQALGGHMRRHRSATKIRDNIDSTSFQDELIGEEKKRSMLALDLDLNLPAPTEDDHRREMDRFSSTNQQPRLVFSAAGAGGLPLLSQG
ncbi:zinc finger protein zat5 [Phtheirospermum japonicum]|uniref:Zinc finger protein zat5 n=1 Tax=Phtheirospermum japonicum TaxID=374723 RepID=A0A830DFZ1_9LAMI|nr:zinc finger protein zat5 [Phtheirospermum japonicum]